MKFGETLKKSLKEEWKDNYIDYGKLKKLLREKDPEPTQWTEQDESNFVEELVNVQIEKVNTFHAKLGAELKDRVNNCEAKLEPLAQNSEGKAAAKDTVDENTKQLLATVTQELDTISKEIADLYKFARLNFTACLKAAKKHDRLKQYKIRPLVQVRLSSLPFSSEDYSPLLYRISALYAFVGQYDQTQQPSKSLPSKSSSKTYESHKFWVHPDNLLEVKTYVLRRLPVLIYNPQSSKVAKADRKDPTLTSLYFDNSQFDLYTHKLDRYESAASLRLRWYGQLADRPEITLERKIVPSIEEAEETGTEERVSLKEKEIQRFISGEDGEILEKKIRKTKERKPEEEARKYERTARNMHAFVKENSLQPILRAVYTRTAFQIPGDDEIRISLDTDLVFIKEDALNSRRPTRLADDWHRHDIDDRRLEYPFSSLPKDEISKFPFALLEIKINNSLNDRSKEWVSDLMTSHLVYEAPRFSKFVHGVSVLFEDNVNSFPFWLGDLDKDIRKDPKDAWQQEQDRLKSEEFAVGSFAMGLSPLRGSPFRASIAHESMRPVESSKPRRLSAAGVPKKPVLEVIQAPKQATITEDHEEQSNSPSSSRVGGLGWGSTKQRRRRSSVKLPPGVTKPSSYIKDSGPLQVEAKVWLANQRTFIKWQHICVLLATLSLALYNAAGRKNIVAQGIGFFFTGISVFAGAWGYWMYIRRSRFITDRSEKGFDTSISLIGPIVVCIAMIIALTLNFIFKFKISFTETSFYIEDLTEPVLKPGNTASTLVVQGQAYNILG
ncbi:Phosphate metabolism transcription protein [Orbilia oligospora]|uniref:Phosphate metabolism transcription protein n=1 Tax=Orbilia oligospora TaxID=2813651 RepID=A0A6G1LYL6_ORBOL|nr:Phosphate metabolism transcription protein [Orbilia oligospora]KAF3204086.1 Phosphate metabolism transcription protein [Orbilia oligospora]KAF3210433.1 Phosphate metabolism transcription protein [Orbilia oligospora]KAF3212366.1 Phosphate metabolism transcription protein [Orbilia oligospora]KAF3238605.1 Phosphate metabolism transcription protein [Orbilia oligospora]